MLSAGPSTMSSPPAPASSVRVESSKPPDRSRSSFHSWCVPAIAMREAAVGKRRESPRRSEVARCGCIRQQASSRRCAPSPRRAWRCRRRRGGRPSGRAGRPRTSTRRGARGPAARRTRPTRQLPASGRLRRRRARRPARARRRRPTDCRRRQRRGSGSGGRRRPARPPSATGPGPGAAARARGRARRSPRSPRPSRRRGTRPTARRRASLRRR